MKTFWLIENKLHEDEYYDRMHDALMQRGIDYALIDFNHSYSNQHKIRDMVFERHTDFVVPNGCIDYLKWFVADVVNHPDLIGFTSGAFFNLKKLSFEHYSSYWGEFMLNQDNVMTTYAELIRRKEFFYKILGGDQKAIFVRPVSNDKIFTGRLIYDDMFDKDIRNMGCSVEQNYPKDMMVVIAAPINVQKEWRFAVVNGKIVASTLYNVKGLHEEKEGCDNPEAVELATKIAAHPWQPDDVYVLDICETKHGNIRMMEIGSLNSAGWYQMDVGSIIDGLEAWKGKYEGEYGK